MRATRTQALGRPGGHAGPLGEGDRSPFRGAIEAGRRAQGPAREPAVETASQRQLPGPPGGDPHGDGRRGLGLAARSSVPRRDPGHPDPQVDAVAQRPGDAARGSVPGRRRAAAAPGRVAVPAARAGVHRRDELEAGREDDRPPDPRDRDPALLQRLAQRLQRGPVELGQLVEEEHAVVREGDLARRHPRPAADERRVRGGVVGRAERARRGRGRGRALRRRPRRRSSPRAPRRRRAAAAGPGSCGPASSCRTPADR